MISLNSPPHSFSRAYCLPFFLNRFISQFSSDQTVDLLILCHHHILHLSLHQKRNYIFQSKRVILLSVVIPPHQQSQACSLSPHPLSRANFPFVSGKLSVSKLSLEQTVYLLILRHHHSLHSSPHHKIKSILPAKKGYLIISCYLINRRWCYNC